MGKAQGQQEASREPHFVLREWGTLGINTPTASSGPSCSHRSAASPGPPSQATASHSPTAPTRRRGALPGPKVSSGPVPAGISPHTQVQTQRLSPGCPPQQGQSHPANKGWYIYGAWGQPHARAHPGRQARGADAVPSGSLVCTRHCRRCYMPWSQLSRAGTPLPSALWNPEPLSQPRGQSLAFVLPHIT